jgi:predicted secreted protein
MAKPTTAKWTKLTIWLGDGAMPTEVFTSAVCGLITKGIAFSTDTGDTVVPDCTNPDLPSWVERVPRSFTTSVTGAGVMAEETLSTWRTWFLSGAAKNARIALDLVAGDGYFAGSFILTAFELTGNEADGKVQINITMQSDGQITWVTGTPG